jgi:hypothetical protein
MPTLAMPSEESLAVSDESEPKSARPERGPANRARAGVPVVHELPGVINRYVESRLGGMRKTLVSAYEAGQGMSSASKGNEREAFVKGFLAQVFSPAYRFGTGDITGASGERSGQIDVVVESPFWYSLPMQEGGSRLYLAEGVGAAIEVKSDIAAQWGKVKDTVGRVKTLRRRYQRQNLEQLLSILQVFGPIVERHAGDSPKATKHAEDSKKAAKDLVEELEKLPENRLDIPCYAVGFTGWRKAETVFQYFQDFPLLDGLVVLDTAVGCFRSPEKPAGGVLKGDWVLGLLLDMISSDIAEVAKMELPQMGNYSLSMVHDLITDPFATLKRIEEQEASGKARKKAKK